MENCLIHAFVSSRLDYCNVLFSGLPKCSLKKLQVVQNAAAGVLTRTRKFLSITPVLFRTAAAYEPSRALRSQNTSLLLVPIANKKSVGSRAFCHRAPVLWNRLPVEIRQSSSLDSFKSKLKTYLYTLCFNC
ncbi:hypothetical protein LDENG_00169080 [Lucifuga dentata]|nr:hypothetical protein LDENG_00169080 [Lucifuga dentata]